jgi:hypothetical protein
MIDNVCFLKLCFIKKLSVTLLLEKSITWSVFHSRNVRFFFLTSNRLYRIRRSFDRSIPNTTQPSTQVSVSGLNAQTQPSALYITHTNLATCMRKKLPLFTLPQPRQTKTTTRDIYCSKARRRYTMKSGGENKRIFSK